MKKIVVLGGGESGTGAAILAQRAGLDVFLSDASAIKPQYKEMLDNREIRWEENGHTEEEILSADEIIKSPGIPDKVAIIQQAKEKGIPIISEIEFAGRYTRSKMICITGSNGKTTTTTLIHHIFREAGLDASLAGNIGKSLAFQVAEEPHAIYIVELSSFQLDNMYDFHAHTSILLNITPDHLDRYDYKIENYKNSKFRITQNQNPVDGFIYWIDDPLINKEIDYRFIRGQIGATICPFGDKDIDDGVINYDMSGTVFSIPIEELPIKGKHNVYNSMAAILAAKLEHIKDEVIYRALVSFQPVEHRLEPVAEINQVHYINDSKATNVNSCFYALESMQTPVVLILGGTDKGNDYTEIESLVKEKVYALVFLGVDNSKLHAFFDGKVDSIADATSMKEAVEKATAFARPGDTVLLSPCCASFDLFKNYEDRGKQFKEYVHQLES